MSKTTIHIKGTHCKACKALIEDVASEIDGIKSCNINFETGETVVEHEEGFDWSHFKAEVDSLGEFTVELPN